MRKLLVIFLLLCAGTSMAQKKESMAPLQKFMEFYGYLNSSYIDTLNNNKLVETAIEKILAELDPHSAYIPADEMIQVRESFEGSFSGIGIEFNVLQDTLIVVNTISGGPAEKVGLLPNDKILTVEGEPVIGITQNQVHKYLRGPKGSTVNIEVKRRGAEGPLPFRIIRDNIPINTIDAAYRINDSIGYIRVNRFAGTTMKEFYQAYGKMKDVGALILDLRSNGGGLLDQSIEMAGFFLPRKVYVVSTEGKSISETKYAARMGGEYLDGKVIVLINETSASASEIVAGAIQDWDRGLIVGRRSFGKGLVQREYPLSDGSAVRITVARYHTPSGRVIQRPFENGKSDEYYLSLYERIGSGVDSLMQNDSLKYETKIARRTVYGGGGIYPDIYVKADTTGYSAYWTRLVRMGVINEYVVGYMDTHRKDLIASYPTLDYYIDSFAITDEMLSGLVSLGEKRNVEKNDSELEISKNRIKLQLKSLIAQKIWDMEAYFRIINSEYDPELAKAVEILSRWDEYGGDKIGVYDGK